MVMSVGYSDFKAEIKMVDSQESLMGGVLMMVNGSLSISQDISNNWIMILHEEIIMNIVTNIIILG